MQEGENEEMKRLVVQAKRELSAQGVQQSRKDWGRDESFLEQYKNAQKLVVS